MSAKILAAVDDIFFAAKIRGTAESLGVSVAFPRDAQTGKHDPFTLAERLRSDERLRGVPIVGFFSHVETVLQRRAEAAGIDHVMPRSLFTRRLADIVQGKL